MFFCFKKMVLIFIYNIKYEINKLDLIGIPDFGAGAMENWGLITFRPELLYCNDKSKLSNKQEVCNTICHELAHQWFGNLVTMEWWDYLWLNESMATFFGTLLSHILFPEWEIWNEFVNNEYRNAMYLDSLVNSHPIETHISNSKDINEIFDDISYSKGSCIVRMMVNLMGFENFRAGMCYYMEKYKYKNTKTIDLLNCFDAVMKNNDISTIMNTWIYNTGYPIIKVEKNKISQERYYRSNDNKKSKTIWIIPLFVYNTETNKDEVYIFDTQERNIDENLKFIIDPMRYGFYKINYVSEKFDYNELSDKSQAMLLENTNDLLLSQHKKMSDLKNLIKKSDLNNRVILKSVSKILINLLNILENTKLYNEIHDFGKIHVINNVNNIFDEIGFIEDNNNENTEITNLRDDTIGLYLHYKNVNMINKLREEFNNKKYSNIYLFGKYMNSDEYIELIKALDNDNSAMIKDDIYEELCMTIDKNLIKYFLDNVLLQKVKSQDIWYVLRKLFKNKEATNMTWDFVVNNWGKFLTMYEDGSGEMSNLVSAMSFGLNTYDGLEKYKNFFKNNIPNGSMMNYNQSCETIMNKIKLINYLESNN